MIGKLDKSLPIFSQLESLQHPGKNGLFFILKSRYGMHIQRKMIRLYYDKQYQTRVYLCGIYCDAEKCDDDDDDTEEDDASYLHDIYKYVEIDNDYISEFDYSSTMASTTCFYKENGFDAPDEFVNNSYYFCQDDTCQCECHSEHFYQYENDNCECDQMCRCLQNMSPVHYKTPITLISISKKINNCQPCISKP